MANKFKYLNDRQREIVKKVYGLTTESEVDNWELDPKNIHKKTNVINGKITKNSLGTGILNPNKIIVSAEGIPTFPNKEIEKQFLNDLTKKFKSPLSRSKYTNEYFANKYNIGIKQAARVVPYVAKEKKLEYPSGRSPETEREFVRTKRKESLFGPKGTSSSSFEGRILRIKRGQDLDLAHRVAKNITQTTNTLGLDSPIINQVVVKPSENLINEYYKVQKNIGKQILNKGETKELLEKLDDINSKIFAESLRTKGRVVGSILLPDKSGGLVSTLVGVNPKLSIDFGFFDQNIKDLEKEIGFNKFRGIKIGTPEFFEKLKTSGANIEKSYLFYNKILPSVIEYNKSNPINLEDFSDLMNTKERQKAIIKSANKFGRKDLIPKLEKAFKKIPLKYGLLGGVGLASINAAPSKAMTTAETDQAIEGQIPEPKLTSPIKYDSYVGFVNPETPNQKASQSDLLYWIADNEIPEDVKEIGKTIGEMGAIIGGATVGFGLPDAKKTIEEAKAVGKSPVKSVLGKGFYRLGSPFATAAFTVPQLLDEKETLTDIATDPLNYLGLATMETLGKRAGTIAAPAVAEATGILGTLKNFATLKNVGEAVPGKLNAALRLGLSPRVIAGASRFLGIPGLIASTGYSLYDYLSDKDESPTLSSGLELPDTTKLGM